MADCAGPQGLRFPFILWDMDGTLLDTLDDLARAGNAVCRARGWPERARDEYRRLVGDGQRALVRRLAPAGTGAQTLDLAYREYVEAYEALGLGRGATAPYPGMAGSLARLKRAGARMGVLTNKDQRAADALARRWLGGLVCAVQGRVDGTPPKPDPAGALALMRRLGARPEATLMVGDSDVDIACGKAAGVATCGAAWGFRGADELERAGADWVAESPQVAARLALGLAEPRA